MRGLIATLTLLSTQAMAHSGHGAPEGHSHWAGAEHGALLLVILAFLAYALKK